MLGKHNVLSIEDIKIFTWNLFRDKENRISEKG